MNSTDLPTCINNKLERYFRQLKGEKAHDVHAMVIQETELATLKFVLELTNNNQSEAARILGVSRGTLKKKISLYRL